MMKGWKTWAGAGLVVLGAILRYMEATGVYPGGNALADSLIGVGAALGLVGVAHKVEKNAKRN